MFRMLAYVLFHVTWDMEFEKKFLFERIHGFFYENDPLDVFMKGGRTLLNVPNRVQASL